MDTTQRMWWDGIWTFPWTSVHGGNWHWMHGNPTCELAVFPFLVVFSAQIHAKSMQNPRDLRASVWLETCLVRKNACLWNHDASNKKSWTLHFLRRVCVFGSLPRWPKKNLDEKILCICQTSHFWRCHVEFRRYYRYVDVYVYEYTRVHEYTCVNEYTYV